MKILRMFDSLKFVRAMFVAVACVFILNVAHADNPNCANYIDYTSATGTVSQNGTPTPTNPIEPQFYNQGKMVLRAVGDVADSYDAETGKITRRVGVNVLDGTEKVAMVSGLLRLERVLHPDKMPNTQAICTHFRGDISPAVSNQPNLTIRGHTSTGNVYIKDLSLTTVEDWKQFLADQYAAGTPVIVVYPLATPVTEDWPSRQCETIKIATTKYSEAQFAPVETRLDAAVAAVNTVVTQTMSQAQAIDTIATSKQTRPDEGCTAKYCLLVEDEDGTPRWYPIAGANGVAHALPAGYTELQYIESTGSQRIDTGIKITSNDIIETEFKNASSTGHGALYGVFALGSSSALYANGTYYGYDVANNKVDTNVSVDTTWHNVIHNFVDGTLKLDDTTVEFAPFSFTNNVNSHLFTRYYDGTYGYYFSGYVKKHKITRNGVVIIDLIPARRNSDGVVGMYDLADSNPETAFHTNAGTGEFVAGPDM